MAGPKVKPYSMSTIKSRLLRPALTSNFICGFTPPSSVDKENTKKPSAFANFMSLRKSRAGFDGAVYTDNQELIELSCSEASLPGSSLATNEINNDYTGVTERHAYRRLYDDRSDFTFYVDSNYYIIDYFENWIAFISGENDLGGQVGREFNYRVKFPNDYKTDSLYITKFERDHDRTDSGKALTYKFINAYPISINSMPVSYDSSQLLKCTVSFTYSRYVISKGFSQFASQNQEPSPPSSEASPPSNDPNVLGNSQRQLDQIRSAAAINSLNASRTPGLLDRVLSGNARSQVGREVGNRIFNSF